MFIVLLRFARHKDRAAGLMAGHNAWLRHGFDEGVFLMAGSVKPAAGGMVIAYGVTGDELRRRLDEDPFVAEGVVEAEIIEIAPGTTDPRLSFLLD